LLSALGTGQQVTVYNSLISGPKKNSEDNGPEKMIVLLLDNNRSKLAQDKKFIEALKCIRCGACLNACPIYKNVGGYTYNTTYSGPIGSVITPFLKGFEDFNHLSFACSTCGACTEVCPVKVPLHDLLLENRIKTIEQNLGNQSWNIGMKVFEKSFQKRKYVDIVNGKFKNVSKKVAKNILGEKKELPLFANQSFNQQWKLNLNK
jgi:L-lactate dehydrogenase complex protein LldF